MVLAEKPDLTKDPRMANRDVLLDVLAKHYDGYRFSKGASERLYNSTLVLHFLSSLIAEEGYPHKMLDLNVRTDYGRLYRIAQVTSEKERDIRELLEEILTQDSVYVELVEQFGTAFHLGRAQIASLFFYMGMLTFADDAPMGEESKLVMPILRFAARCSRAWCGRQIRVYYRGEVCRINGDGGADRSGCSTRVPANRQICSGQGPRCNADVGSGAQGWGVGVCRGERRVFPGVACGDG